MIDKLIFIFVDGVGIGNLEVEKNPMLDFNGVFPQGLTLGAQAVNQDGAIVKAIDACLGVDGLPQSATGQSTMFSSINTAEVLGHHLEAFPNKRLRALLMKNNLLKDMAKHGYKPVFLNAYPELSYALNDPDQFQIKADGSIVSSLSHRVNRRISVSTAIAYSLRQPVFGSEDVMNGHALVHDFNLTSSDNLSDLPASQPADAAKKIVDALGYFDVVLFEYFLTDIAGHSANGLRAKQTLQDITDLIHEVCLCLPKKQATLVVTSDHGNIEEIDHGLHTKNPVPLLTLGQHSVALTKDIHSLTEVTPCILKTYPSL